MKNKAFLGLLFGGLLPVIAFTVIEEYYGILWGVIAGMFFSLGEILWEWATQRKVSAITWATAALILILGGVSLWANEGVWFKLQPAILAAAFSALLIGSLALKKPFLLLAMEKGGREVPSALKNLLPSLTLRLSIFFGIHAALGVWAALSWSTRSWALLKGVGFTMSFFGYMAAEMVFLRAAVKKSATTKASTPG